MTACNCKDFEELLEQFISSYKMAMARGGVFSALIKNEYIHQFHIQWFTIGLRSKISFYSSHYKGMRSRLRYRFKMLKHGVWCVPPIHLINFLVQNLVLEFLREELPSACLCSPSSSFPCFFFSVK